MRISRVITDPECGKILPYADSRAQAFYKRVKAEGRQEGRKTEAVNLGSATFNISITVQRENVWVMISGSRCPRPLSGLIAYDYFNTVVSTPSGNVFRGIYKKAAPGEFVDSARLANNGEQFKEVRATMFSGEMRKVVQMLQGAGQTVPYAFNGFTTHGVMKTRKDARWIIKVSTDGVVAYPMAICVGTGRNGSLGYIPLPTPEPEHPIVLLDAAGMAPAYDGKGPFYLHSGWAFSASGSLAVNCMVGHVGSFLRSWLYQIDITTDPDTGAPAAATLTMLEEGWIHGPVDTHVKFPNSDRPEFLHSLDMLYGNLGSPGDCIAPVFAYFDGEQAQVWRYLYVTSRDDSFTSPGTGGPNPDCEMFNDVPIMTGFFSLTGIPAIKLNDTSPDFKTVDNRGVRTSSTPVPLGLGHSSFDGFSYSFIDACEYYDVLDQGARDQVDNDNTYVLIVTGLDREAAMIASGSRSSGSSHLVSVNRYAARRERYSWVQPSTPCDATSDLNFIDATVGSVTGIIGENAGVCDGGIFKSGSFTLNYIPGIGPGSLVTPRLQRQPGPGNDFCQFILETTAIPSAQTLSSVTVPAWDTLTLSLKLKGSGGLDLAVDVSDEEMAPWFSVIEPGLNDQIAIITRDAFMPTRVAYTKTPNLIAGLQLGSNEILPYGLDDVRGSQFFFVGEP